MEYRIAEADSRKELQEKVNRLLAEGWDLQGGVCVSFSPQSGKWWFYQALVRELPAAPPAA
jgi:hypothetical protein